MAKPTVRFAAAQINLSLDRHQSSLMSLVPSWSERIPETDRALLQELSYGVARWSFRLDAIISRLMPKPLRNKDRDVHALLRVGIYQLAYLSIPQHAVINTTVAVTLELKKKWARGFVNALLRRYQREQADIDSWVDTHAPHAFPPWLIDRLHKDWPEDADRIQQDSNRHPPMVLRINVQKESRDTYLNKLISSELSAVASPVVDTALTLNTPCRVQQLPDFEEGHVSVQDTAAQLAAHILNPGPAERVLDACAAPGGKTCHLAELQPQATVTALDNSDRRSERITENVDRLQLGNQVTSLVGDAQAPKGWWDGNHYDAILMDAPCTGTGVLRRHPDIKLLRRPEDVDNLVNIQKMMLRALWPLVKPGGRFLYATCSVLKCENEQQIASFLQETPDAHMTPLPESVRRTDWGKTGEYGTQILVGDHGMDGFFYALLTRAESAGA